MRAVCASALLLSCVCCDARLGTTLMLPMARSVSGHMHSLSFTSRLFYFPAQHQGKLETGSDHPASSLFCSRSDICLLGGMHQLFRVCPCSWVECINCSVSAVVVLVKWIPVPSLRIKIKWLCYARDSWCT